MTAKTIRLFQQMADLTAPECASACRAPHACCSPEYCLMAEVIASDDGVTLAHTDHPTLPFMSPTGCLVPPHYRPLCTLHTCDINNLGFKRGDPAWTAKYFKLRAQIEKHSHEYDPRHRRQ